MNLNNRHPADDGPPVPARLASALAKLEQRHLPVPPRIDEAVLAEAQRHLKRASELRQPETRESVWAGLVRPVRVWLDRSLTPWRPAAPWAALAAVMVAAAFVARMILSPAPSDMGQVMTEDLNGDGRVDVLDAFALARQLKPAGVPDRRLDLNRDGAVNQRDVELVAAHAVSLEGSDPL